MSKDGDFVLLHALDPDGSAVVWVRLGNATTPALLAWITPRLPAMIAALEAREKLVELT